MDLFGLLYLVTLCFFIVIVWDYWKKNCRKTKNVHTVEYKNKKVWLLMEKKNNDMNYKCFINIYSNKSFEINNLEIKNIFFKINKFHIFSDYSVHCWTNNWNTDNTILQVVLCPLYQFNFKLTKIRWAKWSNFHDTGHALLNKTFSLLLLQKKFKKILYQSLNLSHKDTTRFVFITDENFVEQNGIHPFKDVFLVKDIE